MFKGEFSPSSPQRTQIGVGALPLRRICFPKRSRPVLRRERETSVLLGLHGMFVIRFLHSFLDIVASILRMKFLTYKLADWYDVLLLMVSGVGLGGLGVTCSPRDPKFAS